MQGNTATHTYTTLWLPPSHHCLHGEVYHACEHVGLDTNPGLHHAPERDVLG